MVLYPPVLLVFFAMGAAEKLTVFSAYNDRPTARMSALGQKQTF